MIMMIMEQRGLTGISCFGQLRRFPWNGGRANSGSGSSSSVVVVGLVRVRVRVVVVVMVKLKFEVDQMDIMQEKSWPKKQQQL